jgi:hypothetical protein
VSVILTCPETPQAPHCTPHTLRGHHDGILPNAIATTTHGHLQVRELPGPLRPNPPRPPALVLLGDVEDREVLIVQSDSTAEDYLLSVSRATVNETHILPTCLCELMGSSPSRGRFQFETMGLTPVLRALVLLETFYCLIVYTTLTLCVLAALVMQSSSKDSGTAIGSFGSLSTLMSPS